MTTQITDISSLEQHQNQVLIVHCNLINNTSNNIIVSPSSLAKHLLNADLAHNNNNNNNNDDANICFTHEIYTKYYNATLHFSMTHFYKDHNHLKFADESHESKLHPHALIVTFDHSTLAPTNDNKENLHQTMIDTVQKCIQLCKSRFFNVEVCLCVSLSREEQNEEHSDHLFSSLNEICIEEQFELIRQLNPPAVTSNEDSNNDPFEEKYGSDRVLEALSSTMWPQMDKPTAKPNASVTDKQQQHQEDRSSTNTTSENETHISQLMNEVFKSEDLSDDAEEQEMKQFDDLLNAMIHMRRTASTMSDEDRKKRAADLAMNLLGMLNMGEDEDE